MLSVIVVVIAAAVLAWYEIPRLRKRGWIRELWTFLVFLLIGVSLCALYLLHVPIPSPVVWIRAAFEPVSEGINDVLGLK
ncbi:MAG: hypothetical protein K0Q63_1356 [Paenibacillus sp.]|jgi:hypothetical protein|nr:hypothetical protein [Paenibacillus sp.]